ncbi:complex I NDUFA9 subunit family protein [Pseudomonadota bacterium]
MMINRVCILGGSGFVGRHLASKLVSRGIQCLILTRNPARHKDLRILPGVQLLAANIYDAKAMEPHLASCDAFINLVGILNEGSNKQGFKQAHVDLVDAVIKACRNSGVSRLLHMSALNANQDQGPSRYLFTKGEGENLAHKLSQPDIKVTSFRPSVIFGPGDSFFNRFSDLLNMAPAPFPLACPDAHFAPVYIGNIVDAFIHSLYEPSSFDQRYDLCGPRVFTLEELVRYTAHQLGLKRQIIRLSDRASKLQAEILGRMPGQPFSMDNYLSMQVDSVCQHNGLPDLGIAPADVDEIVPLYLGLTKKQRRLSRWRQAG